MKIVTGHTGSTHITSNDWQALNQGIFGTGNYVLNCGYQFEATVDDSTHIIIKDGEGVLQGVHFRVEPGTVDTVTIESGTSGYNRIDLICAKYTKDALSGVESVEWEVIKGTPTESTPSAPSYTEGDILAGDTLAEFPIWQVTLTGLTPAISRHYNEVIPLVGIVDLVYPVGSIYMSVSSSNPSTLFGGVWAAWGSGRVPVGVDINDTPFDAVEKTGGEKTHTLTTTEMPAHTHNYANYIEPTLEAIEQGRESVWSANLLSIASPDYVSTSTGGGGAHNNLQPYITCYMWKRTA